MMGNNLKHHGLENGVNVYFYKDKTKHSVYFNLIVKYGARNNEFEINNKKYIINNGMAHFLEHFVSEKNNYGDLGEILGSKQIKSNANTSYYRTIYHFTATNNISYGVKTMIRGVNNVSIEEWKLAKTKPPIYREISRDKDDVLAASNALLIKNSLIKNKYRSILGTIEDIDSINLENAKLCYNVFYQPKNQVIIIGGNFDEEKMLSLIKKCYSNIDKKNINYKMLNLYDSKEVIQKYEKYEMATGKPLITICYKLEIGDLSGKDRINFGIYMRFMFYMNFGIFSNTYKKLIKEKIISSEINFSISAFDNVLLVRISSYTEQGSLFLKTIEETVKKRIFNKELFELIRTDVITRVSIRPDDLKLMINVLASNITMFNYDKFDTIEDIKAITEEKYKSIIDNLDFSNYTVVEIVPNK